MAGITVDFRLMDARYELWALSEHLIATKGEVMNIEKELPEYLRERMRMAYATGDESERDLAGQEAREIQKNILSRFKLNLSAVAIYCTLELCLAETMALVKSKNPTLQATKLKGRSVTLTDAREFFKETLGVDFCPDGKDWARLEMLSDVRNCISHSNGFVDLMNKKSRAKIDRHIHRKVGLEVTSSVKRLFVRPEFLDTSHEIVDRVANDLMDQVIVALDKTQKGGVAP